MGISYPPYPGLLLSTLPYPHIIVKSRIMREPFRNFISLHAQGEDVVCEFRGNLLCMLVNKAASGFLSHRGVTEVKSLQIPYATTMLMSLLGTTMTFLISLPESHLRASGVALASLSSSSLDVSTDAVNELRTLPLI